MGNAVRNIRLETLLLHGAVRQEGQGAPTAVPLHQSAAFSYDNAGDLEDLFRGRLPGHAYSRISNPTNQALEQRFALLEGGISATVTSSGMAAIAEAILAICGSGDEVASSSSIFGGTYSLFKETLPGLGITVRFFDPCSADSLKAALTDKTKLIFIEAIGNPKLDLPDIERISGIANSQRVPLFVDSTLATPCLLRPGELGADVVIHSSSKFIGGAGNSIGGVVIDMGSFHWDGEKFPLIAPYLKYGSLAFTARLRKSVHKDIGGCAAPFNSFLLLTGLETLSLRMERQCKNAAELAWYLKHHEKVSWINYPGMAESPWHRNAARQFRGRFGAVLTFGLGNKERAFNFINGLTIARNAANVGDSKTLVVHPDSTICCDFSPEEKNLMGVTEDMVRVSVGIEAVEDIIEDFGESLDKV